MIKFFRKPSLVRILSLHLILCLLLQVISPTAAFALTSGPGQEEFASFEPASTTDMVDLYTGDFTYNIPLLSVPGPNGGYPISLAYHSGVGMEQEASWVGLGWTLNVGAINRNLRGLPDDFSGDNITKTQHIKQDITTSLDIPTKTYREVMGFPPQASGSGTSTSQSLQLYYNSYRGIGTRYTLGFSRYNETASAGLNISFDSQSGMGIGLNFNAKGKFGKSNLGGGFDLGANYSSRQGLQSFNFSSNLNYSSEHRLRKLNKDDNGRRRGSGPDVYGTFGGGGSSAISFATVFGVPKTNIQMKSTTVPFAFRFPLADQGFQFNSPWPISGSVHTSKIENKGVENIPAQGYLYTTGQKNALKDFNRKDVMYSKKIPHLGASSFTYDLFTQTGQGTGSMFRPYLNTFGVLSDPKKESEDNVIGGGLELGGGGGAPATVFFHLGVDVEFGDGRNASGAWENIENADDYEGNLAKLVRWETANDRIDYEPYYFQVIGEKTGFHASEDQLADLGNDRAVRFEIEKETHDKGWLTRHFRATDNLRYNEFTQANVLHGDAQPKQKAGHKRAKRATSIETLTNAQAKQYGFSRNVKYKDATNPSSVVSASKDFSAPGRQISEISMLQADGMRYVYGMPAYNNKQIDNVFAVTEDAGGVSNYPTAYIHQGGSKEYGGINVGSTYDEFVSKNEIPRYAHSWLLTSLYSADYLDVTDNGPTPDDFGYWVKFNYKKMASNFHWRAPFAGANYMDGFKMKSDDNKGSYTYGEKEIYVLESIETKTHIAVFETTDRRDGFGAKGEFDNSGMANAASDPVMQKLNKIKLFTQKEWAKPPTSRVPTKVANFEYSYDLCPMVLNNSGATESVQILDANGNTVTSNINLKKGKLTLTKVYFTYQNSTRGAWSPYVFKYGDLNDLRENPKYNNLNMDRWGNYKNPLMEKTSNQGIAYPYIEHPYTEQGPDYYYKNISSSQESLKPAQWNLKEIKLPTGGILKIQYEFDDYAYVENNQAMRIYDICDLQKPNDPHSTLALNANRKNLNPNVIDTEKGGSGGKNVVYFKLDRKISQTLVDLGIYPNLSSVPAIPDLGVDIWFRKLYLDNIPGGYVYFNVQSNLKNTSDPVFDYVKGYAEIDRQGNFGVVSDGGFDFGYFSLVNKNLASPVNASGTLANPFTLASLQHLRAYRNEVVNQFIPSGTGPAAQVMALFNGLPGIFTDLMQTAIGFNNYAYLKDWGQKIKTNGFSTVRLCEPSYKKIGGGVRVKKITLDDNWKNDPSLPATTVQNSLYGQEYDYTTTTTIGDTEVTISSGVAYEPMIGGDESPLRTPVPYSNSIPLHGSYNLFLENPIMEDYYPGPGVGYSKVTVKSIAPEQAEKESGSPPTNHLLFSSAPIIIHEFYTPKDFPVIFDKTDMNPGQPIRIPIMVPALFSGFTTRQAKSQGYSIILNDMAGKQKAITTKTRNGQQIISRQKFIYNTEQAYNKNAVNKLSSKVQTLEIDKNNYQIKYITSIVGQSHDVFVDMNEDNQDMLSFDIQTNFDMQYTPTALLLFAIIPIPHCSKTSSSMRTIVMNKVINRTGILKRVETTTNESTIITENLAFDIETGEPILTKVTNEFKDPVYNFSYPGHWYYDNMGGAYQNFDLIIDPPGNAFTLSDWNGYIWLTLFTPYTNVLNGRKVSEYFSKGDLVLVDYKWNNVNLTQQFHVLNIDDQFNSLLLINNLGELFPVDTEVYSIKVLKSGFKNMQNTKVGSLVFKTLDPVFKDYTPTDLSTNAPNLLALNFENAVNNKIINASAVEYSNDWQVFCGPPAEGISDCQCVLEDYVFDYLNLIQLLKSSGQLLSTDVALYEYDVVNQTETYFNGFSSSLLQASQRLVDLKNQLITGIALPDRKIYYRGVLIGGDLYTLFYIKTSQLAMIDPLFPADRYQAECAVKLDIPAPKTIHDVWTFNNITPGTCESKGVNLTVVDTNSAAINIGITVMPVCAILSIAPPGGGKLRTPDISCSCWTFLKCYQTYMPNYACGIPLGKALNPYLAGMKGMWRPKASYAYHSDRTQNDNIREDGLFTDYARFPWEKPVGKSPKWINATTITKYSPHGFELENKDALGNYSSALFGYEQSLVTAIGSNAKYNEIAFDNFEDYPPGCNDDHFKFKNYNPNISGLFAHTGKYSFKVGPSSSAYRDAQMDPKCVFVPIDDITDPNSSPFPLPPQPVYAHIANKCDCLGTFEPMPDKKYIVSTWVKEADANQQTIAGLVDYTSPKIVVTINSGSAPVVYTFSPKGHVIDGWQQIFESFVIPANATTIKVELKNTSATNNAYFDDIRLHPNDGNMVSYVYDPISLKTLAELDANNYATIYVYDDEGHLNKVKKETTEGVKTIKEGRINTEKFHE